MAGGDVPPRMPSMEPTLDGPQAPSARRKRRWPKVVGIVSLIMAIVVAGVAAGGLVLLNRLSGNVKTVQVETAQAPAAYEPLNLLLMGSDSREGKENQQYGRDAGRAGQRSDTTILLHISADRSSAMAVSIPRDTYVQQPECAADGQPWVYDKFNNAFDKGGPACTTELVMSMTGVPVHHVAVVDFAGFKQVIDALGGVEVCLNEAVYDQDSKLDLPAGNSVVKGEAALSFVRARKALGDGSDIGRIKRQQVFLSSAIRKATNTELLLNPVKLFQILDISTQALTVDEGLNDLGEMRDLVESVRAIDPADITFITMPFSYRGDANVDIDQEKADEIWDAIKDDAPWPTPVSKALDGEKLTVPPDQVSVRVVNASGKRGLGDKAARQLASAGFDVVSSNETAPKQANTKVQYPQERADSARTLSFAVDAPVSQESDIWTTTLVIGKDWSTVNSKMIIAKPKSQNTNSNPEPTHADEPICAG
jgi:LCP family protein required for cell wall assembly